MKTNNVTNGLIVLTPEAISEIVKDSVKSVLSELSKETSLKKEPEDLMSREEVLDLLKINPTTLWNWQNNGKIPFYKFANKCYYKRSEIIDSLIPVKK